MSRLKHTPGPWKWEQTFKVETSLDIIIKNENDKGIGWIYSSNPIENARLIVAAPEMLEALIHADEEICLCCKEMNQRFEDCKICAERQSRIDVIEKATGKKIEEVLSKVVKNVY